MRIRVGVIAACCGMLFALPSLVSAQVPGGVRCVAEPTDQFVTFGDLIECDITPQGDVDLFRLRATGGERVLIQLTGPPTGFIACMELDTPDGGPVSNNACAGGTGRSVAFDVLLSPGIWTIKVSAENNTGTLPYSLQIECLSSALCGGPSDVVCDVQLNQMTYVNGDTVIATALRFANHRSRPVAMEIKLSLEVPGLAPMSLVNAGSNGTVMLPASFDKDFCPAPGCALFQVTPSFPRGSYDLSCRILEPTTGRLLSEDLNPFVIQ